MNKKSKRLAFYTIGHSTKNIEEFVSLLKKVNVELLIDIRSIPRSWTNPQYNKDLLPDNLAPFAIEYMHLAELGGLRGACKEVSNNLNAMWENNSFHHYADYALTEGFRSGFTVLLELGSHKQSAIMCAEAVWWRCHRRIVTDYLLANKKTVYHLMGKDRVELAQLTKGAHVESPDRIIYP